MVRLGIIGILVAVVGMTCHAQEFYHSTRNYKAVDGLPQSQVTSLAEDQNGYLWMGTLGGGLARFDGRVFNVYSTLDGLLSNEIYNLHIDHNQNIWALHSRGLTRFDGRRFKPFQLPGSPSVKKSFRRIHELNDTIFVTSFTHYAKIYKDSVYFWEKEFLPGSTMLNSYQAPTGEIFFFIDNKDFYVWTRKKRFKLKCDYPITRVYHYFSVANETYCWSDQGFMKFNLKTATVEESPVNFEGAPLLSDADEDVLWTRNASGTLLFKDHWENEKLKRDTILRDVEVNQILKDAEGNTWFASNGGGLYKYFIQDFDRCSSDKMRAVMSVYEDRNGVSWIGTMSKGLWKIKDGKIDHYEDDYEMYRNSIRGIVETPDGTIWVGSGFGLGKYDEEHNKFSWYTRKDGLTGNSVLNIQVDEKGNLWLGTGNGVSYFDGKTFKNYTNEEGLSSNMAWATYYHKPNKTLYIGNEFGVNTIREGKTESLHIPGLDNMTVTSINAFRDSLIVIGTSGMGFMLYNPATGDRKLITTHDGLTSGFVYFVAHDKDDFLWIGTEKGISRIRLDNDFNIVANLHYDYDNGLTGVETNQNAFYLGDKKKYFGLIDGLYTFNNLNRQDQRSFDLHLTDIEILYGEHAVRDYADSLYGFFKLPYKPQFPPDKNHITFHFNRVDKRYPKSVRFRYILENFDKTWSQPSSSGQVTYSNLPPGDYVFRVMATNNQGSWADSRLAYSFTILRPFYLTTSFIAGMLILFAGSVTLLLYIRVRYRVSKMLELERIRQQEQESLRKEIARDFHDEMGNQLTRIINYVSLLKLNGNGNGHSDLYTKVESSAKYLYSGTRDFIWAIDPVNDELSKLFIHIRDFGEKLFEEKSINFRAFNEIKQRLRLPYGFSREANLIFKEAMTNAFKYSNAKNVTLQLTREPDDVFQLSIEDDGAGFLTGETQKSNGLKNIRERAERIQAVLRINSIKDRGTKIVLQFKLTKTLKYGLAF